LPVDPRDAVAARQTRAKGGTQLPGRSHYGDGMMHGGNYGAKNKKIQLIFLLTRLLNCVFVIATKCAKIYFCNPTL
jgi:hypothetical protein